MTSQANKRYLRTMIPASIAYVGLLFLALELVKFVPPGPWRYLLALLPVAPCLWGLWAVIRLTREVDELQQRILLEAATFSLGVTVAVCLTWFFLYRLAGVPHLELVWVVTLIIAAWGIGLWRAKRRYGA